METQLNAILKQVGDKLLQIAFSVIGGLYVAFEASNSRHTLYDFNTTRQVNLADIFYAVYLGNMLSGNSINGRGKGWLMSYMNR